jgi:GNAT superfamily N-acetyltransferase
MAQSTPTSPTPSVASHLVEELNRLDYLKANQAYLEAEGYPSKIARQLTASGEVVGATSDVWKQYGSRLHSSLVCCCELHLSDEVARPENLFTFYGARRQGYAGSVFAQVLQEALAYRPRLIFVVVLEGNAEATPLYAKNGFREVGVINVFEVSTSDSV